MEDPFDLPPDVLRRIPLFAELSKVMSWTGGPVNWDLARQIAVSIAAGEQPAAPVQQHDHDEVAEHIRIAEMWLTDTTGFESPSHLVAVRAATPAEWADQATTGFAELIDPVAAKVTRAMSDQGNDMGGDADMMTQALGHLAPMFLAIQVGTILGNLARDVTGVHDTGLPTAEDGVLLVVSAIDELAVDYQLDARQVRQWIALRAAAHRLVYEALPLVRTHFYSLYHGYVAALDFDFAEGIRRLQDLDITDPSRLHDALGDEGLFSLQPSEETQRAGDRVATLLGVVDAVTSLAADEAGARAGETGKVAEAFRRRGAEHERGSKLLTQFIGLDRERANTNAHAFVRAIVAAAGWPAVARIWGDLDTFPSDAELSDPDAWLKRVTV